VTTRRAVWGYGLAVAYVAIALLLSLLIHPFSSSAFVYPFLAAVVASGWLGRRGPALFAALLAALTLDYFFLPPFHSLGIGREAWPYVFPFLASALATAWISARLTSAADKSRLLACAVEQAADSIVITDLKGNVEYANPAFTALTGYTAQEIIGRNPRLLKSGRQDPGFYQDLWKTILTGRSWQGRLINRRKDGSLYPEELTIAPVRNAAGAVTHFIAIKQDATERAKTEELRAFLASLVECSADAIIGCTPEGTILSWNRAAEGLYGYRAEKAIGEPFLMLAQADRTGELRTVLERVRGGESVIDSDTVLAGQDGRRINVSLTISPVKGPVGEVAGLVANTRDITAQKRAEEVLAERAHLSALAADISAALTAEGTLREGLQQLCEALVKHLDAAFARIWTLNENTQVLELEASAGMYRHIDGAHARVPVGKFKIGRIAQECKPHLSNDVPTDDWVSDPEWVRREGLVAFAGYPLTLDGRVIGVMAAFAHHPFSEGAILKLATTASRAAQFVRRKRSDEALRASEERFRQLAEHVREVFFIAEPEPAGIIYLSPAYETIWGRPRQEVYRRREAWLDAVHPDDRAAATQHFAQTSRGEHSEGEFRILRPDGSERSIRARAFPVVDTGGTFRRLVGIAEDVTDARRAEAEMLAAQKAAEAASQAKSDFLANMSHEIRTPMNSIIGMTDMVLESELTSQQRDYLTTVKAATDSLLHVINDILDFSKIEARKLDLEFIEFRLKETVDAATKSLGLRAAEKNLELACHYEADVPAAVRGDPGRLRQVLVNLIGNAIKFTARGEVLVHVSKLSETAGEVRLHFSVSDTGIGIPGEKHKAIFGAFAQADTSSTRRFGGTGLGLTISAQLVEMMGGRISVESDTGKGSTFHFEVRLGKAEAGEGPVPRDVADLRRLPVLVVDDNATNRGILAETLSRWGMIPTQTAGGAQALAAMEDAQAAGRPYALVIVDARMPDMDGFTLVERIRTDPRLRGAPIMMLTAYGQQGDAARSRESGASACLTKPVGVADLLQTTLQVLGECRPAAGKPQAVNRPSLWKGGKTLRVLIAEDNPANQLVARRLIQKQGHWVEVVGNGREALEALREKTFDLVLMDVQMPVMDGLAATAAIRQRERDTGAHLPIIALTASVLQGDEDQCLQAGMDAFVSKPVSAAELFAAIERVMAVPPALESRLHGQEAHII
jgi:two-component system sensor histidine kinase/response regulator